MTSISLSIVVLLQPVLSLVSEVLAMSLIYLGTSHQYLIGKILEGFGA